VDLRGWRLLRWWTVRQREREELIINQWHARSEPLTRTHKQQYKVLPALLLTRCHHRL
jgi:hypothetical protein